MWSQSVVVESESVRVRNVVKVVALPVLCRKNRRVVVANVSKSNPLGESQSGVASVSVSKEGSNSDSGLEVKVDIDGNGGGDVLGGSGNGRFSSGGGGGGGGDGGDDNGDDKEEDEFGPILKFEEVMKETEARGVSLPSNMLEAAKSVGIRKLFLLRYLDLQGSGWLLGFAMKSCSMLRNRMLADPSFLFKIGTEKYNYAISANFYLGVDDVINSIAQDVIVIDSCCVTVVEVQNRGKDFWAEFELYVADLLVGVVVNVALVGMLAPYARIGGPSISKGFLGRRQHAYGALPSSVFEAERPGCRFTVKQRIGTYFYKGILCGILGFGSGIIGRGIANLIMTAKRETFLTIVFLRMSGTQVKEEVIYL
ncbi:protein reticulata [Quercus suber]|uniref:Protein reticulata n=1 Tax=Quercus suber TaxID=58331 RepID=A0AAW0JRT6_QUESU